MSFHRSTLRSIQVLRPLARSSSTTVSSFIPSFSPTGSTSAATLIPYGDPSLASSAYLPIDPSQATSPLPTTELTSPAINSTPSDLTPKQRTLLERIIRVDQAGELGANYIYRGQLAVLRRSKDREVVDLVQVRATSPSVPPLPLRASRAPLCSLNTGRLTRVEI